MAYDLQKAIVKDNVFRGYDIRGIIPEEINTEGAYLLGRAYATMLLQRRINEAVVVGDNRTTTEDLKKALIEGLIDTGINVIDHGLGPVYFMYFSQYIHQSKGGVSVSASHNPKEYNGFKMAVGFSDTMITEEINKLKEIVKTQNLKPVTSRGNLVTKDIFELYKSDLHKRIPEKFNFKIALDGGNCTPARFMPQILEEYGCEVVTQNTGLDGNFPLGTPDPTEAEYLHRLSEWTKNNNADLGVCYDPDGDRIGIVDEDGSPIWNDNLVSIFAKDILEFIPGSKIVYNTLCSRQVTEVIESYGGEPVMWLTGHSFIKAKVKETRSPFGGELSGHFFFMDNFYGHDDCAFATIRLLSYLSRVNKSLKQVVNELPKYISSPEIKLGLSDDIKFEFVKNVLGNELNEILPNSKVVDIDGIRLDLDDKMAIIRASQNGPYVTIKFEAKSEEEYEKLRLNIGEMLRKHPEIIWNNGVNINIFN